MYNNKTIRDPGKKKEEEQEKEKCQLSQL